MRIGVLRFPGSNCDDDSLHVVTTVLKEKGQFVWHNAFRYLWRNF